MKKTIIILMMVLGFTAVQAQTNVRMKTETVGFATITNDTIQILSTQDIVSASFYVPASSSDSVVISGCTFQVGDITTGSIKIPPGSVAIGIGFGYAELDTVTIRTTGTYWGVFLKDRN